jgi:hypothetical protein
MYTKIRNINKSVFSKQLALPLTFKSIKNRDNFIISKCNQSAINLIDNTDFWLGKKKLIQYLPLLFLDLLAVVKLI